MTWWKWALVVVALVSRLANISLFHISDIADWFWYLFLYCWLLLFVLAASAAIRRRLGEIAIFCLTLLITFLPVLTVGAKSVDQFQLGVSRMYAQGRIGAAPFDRFLSSCKLIDYTEDDGTTAQIGQCNVGFRSGMWPQLDLIYDPKGQVALPGYRRTVAWRLAVEEAFLGGWLVKSSDAGQHVIGDFYLIRLYPDSA
jgi:hypothetical protein